MKLLILVAVFCFRAAAAATPEEIDSYFRNRWQAANLKPSAPVSDGLFLRRAWLDLAGSVPPAAQVAAFEADSSPGKRTAIVEKLLASPSFGQSWADRFRSLLIQNTELARNRKLSRSFDLWLAQELGKGTPYDRMVSRMVAGQGAVHENPEVGYVAQFKDSPEALTGHSAKVFLGVQIQCAQCHDHPFEKWKQRDFYGLHAFFARAQTMQLPKAGFEALREGRVDDAIEMAETAGKGGKGVERRARRLQRFLGNLPPPSLEPQSSMQMAAGPGKNGFGGRAFLVVERPRGEAILPDPAAPAPQKRRQAKGEVVPPRHLDGTSPAWPDPGANRRELLASWMTSAGNPYFARAAVNRVWSWLFGRGLVEPVDNVVAPHDKTHSALLDSLAAHFVQSGYDLKGLVRLLATTRVYQLSIQPSENNAKDTKEFSRGRTRPMEPEQLFASLLEATGADVALRARDSEKFEEMRERWLNRFVQLFENDSEGEPEPFHGTLPQALFLMNAPAIQRAASPMEGGAVRSAVEACSAASDSSPGVERLYLAAYARRPSAQELETVKAFLQERSGSAPRPRPQAWSDLLWALVTSAEFLVNH